MCLCARSLESRDTGHCWAPGSRSVALVRRSKRGCALLGRPGREAPWSRGPLAGQGPHTCGGRPAKAVALQGPCCRPPAQLHSPSSGTDSEVSQKLSPDAAASLCPHDPGLSLDLQQGSASWKLSGGRSLWAGRCSLTPLADMLLDLSDLLQVDAFPFSALSCPGWEGPQAKDTQGVGLCLETGKWSG